MSLRKPHPPRAVFHLKMAAVESAVPVLREEHTGDSELFVLTSFRPYEEPPLIPRSRGGVRQQQPVDSRKQAIPARPAQKPSQPRNPTGGPSTNTAANKVAPNDKQQGATGSSAQRQQAVSASGRKLVSQSSTTSLSGATAVAVTTGGAGGSGGLSQSHRSIVEEQIDKIISSNVSMYVHRMCVLTDCSHSLNLSIAIFRTVM